MNEATHTPEPQTRIRTFPIYSATPLPVNAESSEPSVVGEEFTLVIDSDRVLGMEPAPKDWGVVSVTEEAVKHLEGCAIRCRVLEFKETEARGMVVSIDRIRRGETVVPFHCNRSMVHDPIRAFQPPKRVEFHPENHSWGVLVREEGNRDNLVLIPGAMMLVAKPQNEVQGGA